jgi:hypothetical protein
VGGGEPEMAGNIKPAGPRAGGGVCRSAYTAKMDPCHTFCCICSSGTFVTVICDGSIHSILLLANIHLCYKAC